MTERNVTEIQAKILDFIREYVEARGYAPTVREIGNGVGLRSNSSVSYQLGRLTTKGFIRRNLKTQRALVIRLDYRK